MRGYSLVHWFTGHPLLEGISISTKPKVRKEEELLGLYFLMYINMAFFFLLVKGIAIRHKHGDISLVFFSLYASGAPDRRTGERKQGRAGQVRQAGPWIHT